MEPSGGIARMTDGPDPITTTEARAGTTPRMTRYILVWGLFLVIVAFALIYFLND
jgi:hypothetical protein